MTNDSQSIDQQETSDRPDSPVYMKREERGPLLPWDPRPNGRAWIGSTILHTAVLLLVAFLWKPISKGTGGSAERPAGIALAHHRTNGVEYELQGGGSNASASAEKISEALQNNSNSASSSASMDASMQELLGPLADAMNGMQVGSKATSGIGNAGLSGEGSGGNTRGNAAKTQTSFMGLEGQGSSFVYVVDYSESMSAFSGTPIQRAKQELSNSIRSLTRVNLFQIVFYNDQPSKYAGAINKTNGLIFANDIEKEAAANYVRRIEPFGGTEHYRALLTALSLKPDVVFFLTDAADPSLSQREVEQIVSRAEGSLTTIHTVEFGVGQNQGTGRWIEQLAVRTQGKYRYVDVSSLTSSP